MRPILLRSVKHTDQDFAEEVLLLCIHSLCRVSCLKGSSLCFLMKLGVMLRIHTRNQSHVSLHIVRDHMLNMTLLCAPLAKLQTV